ncbi:MAG: SLBB domain-containing protein [Ignavibacteria bacterium]
MNHSITLIRSICTTLFCVCILMIGISVEAQLMGSSSDFDMTKLMQTSTPPGADFLKAELLPSDNIVDADHYRIGPGDVLSIQTLSGNATEQYVSVSPENAILVPRIGELSLKNATLAKAKSLIVDMMKQRNPNATVTVMLRKCRSLYVSIRGNVRYPGTYAIPASMRVSTVIRLANQPPKSASQQNGGTTQAAMESAKELTVIEARRSAMRGGTLTGNEELPSFVARNITVLHADGTSSNADLEKALALSTATDDPTLREGDQIFVPFDQGLNSAIAIAGAVIRPISIAFKKGDKASMLLKLAYGLTDDADPSNIQLKQGDAITTLSLNDNGQFINDPELMPGAVIVVQKQQFAVKGASTGVVEVTGSVQRPGAYTMMQGQTKLKDIIEQAGGFTDKAYLPLAYIVRKEQQAPASNEPRYRAIMGMQYTDLTAEDTTRYLMHTMFRQPTVACDIQKAFNGSEDDNVFLESGDIIVIPENPKRVYVYGQVNNPGYVTFEPGKSMQWYIDRAGGYASGAEKDLTRIIKGRSHVWIKGTEKNVVVESGDEIYCPPPTYRPPGYEYQYYTFLITAIGGLVGILNVVYWAFLR